MGCCSHVNVERAVLKRILTLEYVKKNNPTKISIIRQMIRPF